MQKKKSFFERLTGSVKMDNEDIDEEENNTKHSKIQNTKNKENWIEESPEEGQLTVDVYQTPTEIVIQTMVAGCRPEDVAIEITRDMVTIKGKREENKMISKDNFFAQELYWGSFSRTILLPQEVDPEEAEAIEKHGLLIIKLPKIDKAKKSNVKVKSI